LDDRSDENVVRACRQGDKAAYAVLVKRHYRHVFALCLGVLGNVHDAEDIAQEAMLRGLVKIKKLGKGEHFEAWILQIAKNLCIDFLRKRKHVKPLANEHSMQAGQKSQENHELEQAVRRLPQELRLRLTMYYFDGKNAKTIAERLNISHSGACQRIRAGRQELHKLLTERSRNEQRM
jgi:RNA polymerase sigma-70 factor (ECF subfamily)